jgi:hypothetical protein
MKFLGVEDYDELPIIYKKTDEQNASVQMYICELLNEKHKKEDEKKMLLNKIEILEKNQLETNKNKNNFSGIKKNNIEKLKAQINKINNEINEKRDFFSKLQPMSDKFLNRLNNTYVSDYIPNKVRMLNMKYNESNVSNVFDNISNYYKLIVEMEKSLEGNNKSEKIDNTNKKLDSLGLDFQYKLENFKFDGYLNPKLIRQEHKNTGMDYVQTIEKLSENIINLTTSGSLSMSSKFSKTK